MFVFSEVIKYKISMEHLSRCDICDCKDLISFPESNISKCRSCGYIFCNPRPIFNEILAFYSKADKYDTWISEENGRDALWQRRLAMVKRYKRNGAILDVGSGIGQFLSFARSDFEISGTEISDSAIKISKERYNVELTKGALEGINFGDRRFDVITLFHVLEHVQSPSLMIKKCYNLLKNDGVIIIAVPNDINSFRSFILKPVKCLLSLFPKYKFARFGVYGLPKVKLYDTPGEIHLSHFTSATLKKLLTKNNLNVLDETLDPYYAAVGIKKCTGDLIYVLFSAVKKIFNFNIYDTIWIVASR